MDVLPPMELIARIGDDPGDTADRYLAIGQGHRRLVEGYLPADWVWSGKTVVDWGAGAGRLVRHFTAEAATNRIIAADIHKPSIDWIRDNLAPVEGLLIGAEPRFDIDDASVDLVTGLSVMTHVADQWASWLLELRRILRPDGLALISFCSEQMVGSLLGYDIPMDDIGMLVVKYGNPWRFGGPTVLHAPWWIRAHWGRALEIVQIDRAALQGAEHKQDLAVLRPRAGQPPSVSAVEDLEPGEPRELRALCTALAVSRAELTALRGTFEEVQRTAYINGLVAEDRALQLAYIRSSHSWRLTRPVRNLIAWLRGRARSTLE